ncbi:hypothetical protein SAMN05660236_0390 [Ohtaekwangia koreensis]|uniref:Uncharacterized protein n=1 Tax=Ohtaekwangia koreensis TaxID=688867 RepID=A0A1T5ITR2_9BACT|nr:hypothetical protein SAMN05660236_0390 [Ohtaekwangia koreensis]
MEKKGIGFYLNILGASLGLSMFFKSAWYIVKAVFHVGNPLSESFWDYYFSSFQFLNLNSLLLWTVTFIIVLISVNMFASIKKTT